MRANNLRDWSGIWGPTAFAAGAVFGARKEPGYSHAQNHISGLAAHGTAAARYMVPGFVALGLSSLLLPVDDRAVRRTARLAGAATIAAGLFRCSDVTCPAPLVDDDYEPTDARHAAASVMAFGCWVALPVLAASKRGPRWYRAVSAALVIPTVAAWIRAGLTTRSRAATRGTAQRQFLAAVFAWYAATSARALAALPR